MSDDSKFVPSTVYIPRNKQPWATPDFNPYGTSNTPISKEGGESMGKFKAFGTFVKKNVEDYLKKIETSQGMTDEILGGSGLSGVGGLAGTMMGKMSNTFNTADAIKALELSDKGFDARKIWERTQNRIWKSGIRQEIDDSIMKVNDIFTPDRHMKDFMIDDDGMTVTHLGKLIDHKELFKAYPKLKKTTVRIDPSFESGEAAYNAGSDVITLGTDKAGKISPTDILHEVQHAVQSIEGWQAGGAPSQFAGRTIIMPDGTTRKVGNFKEYETLAGEWEARQTELRAKLSAKNRAKIFPDDTSAMFDYPSKALRVHDPDIVLDATRPKGYRK